MKKNILTVILSIIGGIIIGVLSPAIYNKIFSNRPKIVAEVKVNEFRLIPWEKPEIEIDLDCMELYNEIQTLLKYLNEYRLKQHLVTIKVCNKGKMVAEDVYLHLPSSGNNVVLIRYGNETSLLKEIKKVKLGSIQPHEEIMIFHWVPLIYSSRCDEIRISFSKGIGKVNVYQQITGFGRFASTYKIPFVLSLLLFLGLALWLITYLTWGNDDEEKTSNNSSKEEDKDARENNP